MVDVGVQATIVFFGDGSSNSVTVDLERVPFIFPYTVPVNFFTNDPKSSKPTSVTTFNPGVIVALSGTQMTVTFPSAIPAIAPLDIWVRF
jgi:hypothetical protein